MSEQNTPTRVRTRAPRLSNTPSRVPRLETWSVDRLHATASPVRERGKTQAGAIATSISRFGMVTPIIATPDGEIIDGHGALEGALAEGYKDVPVAIVEGLSPIEIKALRIALNKIAEGGVWNDEALAVDLNLIWTEDPLLTTCIGFEMPELDLAMGFVQPVAGDDKVPPVKEIAVSKLGDLWTFKGGSQLLCGDAKDPASYERVLGGRTVQMVLSDPPYGIAIKNAVKKQREFIEGSGMSATERLAFFREFLNAAAGHIPKGAIVDLFMDHRGLHDLQTAAAEAGLEQICLAVWDKGAGGMGGLYRHAVEFALVMKRPGAPHIDNVKLGKHGRNRTTLWAAPGNASFGPGRTEALARHPTCKPEALLMDAILDVTNPGGICLDMFNGSGSTMVAAFRTGRVGVGIEFDAHYTDVAVRRLQAITGEPAVHAETGLTFDEIAAERLGVSTSAE